MNRPSLKSLLTCLLLPVLGLAGTAQAEDTMNLHLRSLRAAPEVLALMDPAIRMVWHDSPAPVVAESSPVDRFSGTGISIIPFNTGQTHCEEAFRRSLESMISDARKGGYDVVYDIRPALREGPATELDRLFCSMSPATARIALSARLGMTQAARARADSIELETERLAAAANRPAAKGAMYMPLEPILKSDEFKAILGNDIGFFFGSQQPPAYSVRFGPRTYSQTVDAKDLSPEATCRKAALETLRVMVKDARDHGYNAVIRVRSYLGGQLPAFAGDVECDMGSRSAKVQMRAILIQK